MVKKVAGKYRSGHFTGVKVGTVKHHGVVMDKIRPSKASRHPGEKKFIFRRPSKVHSVSSKKK